MFYLLSPAVLFFGTVKLHLIPSVFYMPIIIFLISCLLACFCYWIGKQIWGDSHANITALSAGTSNTGFFGLPVAIALFSESTVSVFLFAILGMTFFENSLGFYFVAKNQMSTKKVLFKIMRLPTLYAVTGALIVNLLRIEVPEYVLNMNLYVRGAYITLGMMNIGISLSQIKSFRFGKRFLALTLGNKFILWPAIVGILLVIDSHYLHLFSHTQHGVFLLTAIVPLASNSVVFAQLFDMHPEKMGASVLISTLVALGYIPLVFAWWNS